MAAFTSGNYTLSAAEQAQALADRDTEAANQVPPPPFQPPPYDLRTFPQLNLHYAPDILSNYFNCQFSLNEKLARHKLSQSGNNVFNDGPSMAARETWSMLSKDYEAGKRMAILTDAQDQQLILILFAGKPIRLPVKPNKNAADDDDPTDGHPQVAIPVCWASSNRNDPNCRFFVELVGFCIKSFGTGATLTNPPSGGSPAKIRCDLEEQELLLATLSRHGRNLQEEYQNILVAQTEDQVHGLKNVKISHAMGELLNHSPQAKVANPPTAKQKKKQKKAMEKKRKLFMKTNNGQAAKVKAMCTGEERGDPCFNASYITQIYASDEIRRTNKKIKKNLKSTCAFCAKTAKELGEEVKLKVCSRCHNQWYCSTGCQRSHWKQGHKRECLSDSKQATTTTTTTKSSSSSAETWIDLDLTNGFQPAIDSGGFIYIRSNAFTGRKAGQGIEMGLKEYKEAIEFMLKKYKGRKQFVVKVQTGPSRQHACQIYDKNRKMLFFARSDISGGEQFNALCDAVEKTDIKRKGYYHAMVLRDPAKGGKVTVRIRIDIELSAQNLHW